MLQCGGGVATIFRALPRMLCSVATRRIRAVTSSASDPEVRSRWEMGTGLRVSLGGGRFPGPSATGSIFCGPKLFSYGLKMMLCSPTWGFCDPKSTFHRPQWVYFCPQMGLL